MSHKTVQFEGGFYQIYQTTLNSKGKTRITIMTTKTAERPNFSRDCDGEGNFKFDY